ncbi:MAG: SDR family NAD(P)-dependent oxidoreductase, partial [Dermatophilaceae bacterium]
MAGTAHAIAWQRTKPEDKRSPKPDESTGLRRAKTPTPRGSPTVVITGAGGDTDRELAIRLSRRAGHLALVDHDPDRLGATVRACAHAAGAVSSWPVDVSAVTQLADDIRANVDPVHALHNLAGVIHAGLLRDSQMADLNRVIRVDLLG